MVDVRKRTLEWLENLERSKRPEDRERQYPPVEATTVPRHYEISTEVAARLNVEIANYNRHRNALSLWNALAICLENKIPVPDELSEFFLNISRKLIGFARDGEKQASRSISNLVLDASGQDGGPGEFRSFQNIEKERAIVHRTGEIVLQRIAGKLPALKSLEAIYESVASEFSVEPEHVKRLFRLYEADAGSFGFRELFKAATSPPQVFASGLDTTHANPDDNIHPEDPSD
ncbi:hypothetical protein JQ614_32250 [Bradyrhizobium diazoefficiens]|uniref:hypothetical protein n=1 Tax=Bradyrhizobium diazoefficiens TaxID=1355477 RepID=UPI001B8B00D5|nr:hypothetical protein [Bradyrhizobium diazoefficiens]MBR0866301.1 hypothetical protein [Bradyrhizobium diazoefficiens]MBR0890762.1 hypothetical protein [Bradyrhizobium diazoefficiens]MBR0922595.1 hypothetical protein [Bradyrhizobium diazoefficiens]